MELLKLLTKISERRVNEGVEIKTVSIEMEGEPSTVNGVLKVLAAIQSCNVGMSRIFKVSVDGDGAAYLKVKSPNLNGVLSEEEAIALDNEELNIGMGD